MSGKVLMVSCLGQVIREGLEGLRAVDIAVHLGRQLRWRGSAGWWTVLQHSLLVECILRETDNPPAVCLWGLLHDAHEVFTGDVPRPLVTDELKGIQWNLDYDIARLFGVIGESGPSESRDSHAKTQNLGDSHGFRSALDNIRAAVAWADDLALIAEAKSVARVVYEGAPEEFAEYEERFTADEIDMAEVWMQDYFGGREETGFVPFNPERGPLVKEWLGRLGVLKVGRVAA